MFRIAAALIMKNEERTIVRCLNSLVPYVNQILIADTGSTDASIEIAKSLGAKVYSYQWKDDFAAARNYILDQSTADYNLVIDADEWVVEWDQAMVAQYYSTKVGLGYVGIRNLIEDLEPDNIPIDYLPRFLPKTARYSGIIHEQIETDMVRTKLPIILNHDGYQIENRLKKEQRNRRLLEKALQGQPDNAYYHYQISKEYNSINDYKKTAIHLEKAYQYLAKDSPLYLDLIELIYSFCVKTGGYDLGMKIIEQNESFFDKNPKFYYLTAKFFIQVYYGEPTGDDFYLELAQDCLHKCIAIGDQENRSNQEHRGVGSFLAMYLLGQIAEASGNRTQAEEWYQQAARYDYRPAVDKIKNREK